MKKGAAFPYGPTFFFPSVMPICPCLFAGQSPPMFYNCKCPQKPIYPSIESTYISYQASMLSFFPLLSPPVVSLPVKCWHILQHYVPTYGWGAQGWVLGTAMSRDQEKFFFFFLDSGFVRLTKTTWSLGYHQNCSLWIILAETQDLWVDGIRQVASASSRPKRRTETPRCFDPWSSVCDPVHTGVNVQVCVCVWFLHLVLVLLAFQSRGYTNYNFMSPSTCTLMPSCGTP